MRKKRFGVSQALSQGLKETINIVENNAADFRNTIVPLSRIEVDPENPRKLLLTLDDLTEGIKKSDSHYERKTEELNGIMELAQSIKQSGLLHPIAVYKLGEKYRIVAGERRYLAYVYLEKQEIEARVFNERPRGFKRKLVQWFENNARVDLTLHERINNIGELLSEYAKESSQTVATPTLLKELTGMSLPQASYYCAILNCPLDLKQAISSGKVNNLDKAVVIAKITDPVLRQQVLNACINGQSLNQLRSLINNTSTRKIAALTAVNADKKRGRAQTRINMGTTTNRVVIKTIIDSVLSRPHYHQYQAAFQKIDWQRYDAATQGFRELISLLEKTVED